MKTKCSCGKDVVRQNQIYQACKDFDGQQKSRYMFLTNGQSCSESCYCINCQNNLGEIQFPQKRGEEVKRKHATFQTYKRKRRLEFWQSRECDISQDAGAKVGSIILFVWIDFLLNLCRNSTTHNVITLLMLLKDNEHM